MPLIEMRFPPPGTLLTPVFPAPTNARTFVILRLLGVLAGRAWPRRSTAGCRPTRRPSATPACTATTSTGAPYLMREVLGGGSGGRYYADGEDTIHVVPGLPEPADRVLRVAGSRSSSSGSGLAVDSGGAGRYRGGLGYEKHIRMLRDAHFMSIADRSILACWGVKGGRAGRPFSVTIDAGRPERARGRRARRRRAGARRRGDPDPHDRRRRLGRPARPALRRGRARRAVGQGVARGRARRLRRRARATASPSSTSRPATPCAPSDARRRGEQPFFDRGPGYARLAAGATQRRGGLALTRLVTRGYGHSTRARRSRTVHDVVASRAPRC